MTLVDRLKVFGGEARGDHSWDMGSAKAEFFFERLGLWAIGFLLLEMLS